MMQFWRDLKNAGFTGSYKRVHQWVQAKRVRSMATGTVLEAQLERSGNTEASATDKKPARTRSFAPKQLAWLLMREDESLEDEDKHVLRQLGERCPDVPKARVLALEFSRLLKAKDVKRLGAWFEAVKASCIPDLLTFAVSLERERAALEAAVSLPWSNGPVEGAVNRIKLLKRQGFGRASFSLLRKRILSSA